METFRRYNRVAHKIVADKCQSLCKGCVDICPTACIKINLDPNLKSKAQHWIDSIDCIDCGICLKICPIVGAIVTEKAEV